MTLQKIPSKKTHLHMEFHLITWEWGGQSIIKAFTLLKSYLPTGSTQRWLAWKSSSFLGGRQDRIDLSTTTVGDGSYGNLPNSQTAMMLNITSSRLDQVNAQGQITKAIRNGHGLTCHSTNGSCSIANASTECQRKPASYDLKPHLSYTGSG